MRFCVFYSKVGRLKGRLSVPFRFCLAACLWLCLANSAAATTIVRLATGGETGVYRKVGLGIKKVVEDECPEIQVRIVPSKGSVDNCRLLKDGQADLAIVQNDDAHFLYRGIRKYSMPFRDIRGVASLYTEFVHIVARKDRHIVDIEDLRHKRIRTDAEKTDFSTPLDILRSVGFTEKEMKNSPMSFDRTVEAVLNDSVDAAFVIAGIPAPVIDANSTQLAFIGISPLTVRKIQNDFEYIVYDSIRKGTYAGQDRELHTVGLRALLVASDGLDRDIVRPIVAAIIANSHKIATYHVAGKEIALSRIKQGMTIPPHPGLQAYLATRNFWEKLSIYLPKILDATFGAALIIFLVIYLFTYKRLLPRVFLKNVYYEIAVTFLCFYACATVAMFLCERRYNPYFETLYESFWSVTVYIFSGFGSRSPATLCGRAISVLVFLILGIGLIGAVTGGFAAVFIRKEIPKMPETSEGHIAVCNWNARGDRIIKELHAPEAEPATDVFVITDLDVNEQELRQSPLYENVYFVKSDPILHAVLKSSRVHLAKSVVILADDLNSDADSKSAMIALAITKLCENGKRPHIVAETMNHRRMQHLKDAGVDETICANDFGLGILAQCALQAKLSSVYNNLLTYSATTNEIYIVGQDRFPPLLVGKSFQECAELMNRHRDPSNPVILLGIRRNGNIMLNPKRHDPHNLAICQISEGDALVVMAYTQPDLSCLTDEQPA